MKRDRRIDRGPLWLLPLLVASVGPVVSAADELRSWTPRDSVSVRYYTSDQKDPFFWQSPGDPPDGTVVYSADMKYFFYLTHHGDLESDTNIFDLNIYATHDVRQWLRKRSAVPLPPFRTLSLRTASSTNSSIRLAMWDESEPAIYFVGISERGDERVNRFDVANGSLTELSARPHRVELLRARGGTVLFVDVAPPPPQKTPYPALFIERDPDGSIDAPRNRVNLHAVRSLFIVSGDTLRQIPGAYSDFWISPDGRRAILATRDKPRRFEALDLQNAMPVEGFQASIGSRVPQAGATSSPAPAPAALWSKEGDRVILVNALIPDGREPAVAAYNFSSARWQVLEPMIGINEVAWRKPGTELVIRRSKDEATVFLSAGGNWQRRIVGSRSTIPQRAVAELSITLRQGANEPPILLASDGTHESALSTPDPALQGVRIARSEPIRWREPDGAEHSGGLTLPPGYAKGQRLPLVIQAYYYYPQFFLPDGPHPSSDSAQALAARGFAILQIDLGYAHGGRPAIHPDDEGEILLHRIEAAVAELNQLGIVDIRRVGLTGFSRAGYQTFYSITHPRKLRIAAAVVDDSFTGSYGEYLIYAASHEPPDYFESFDILYGGTFWEQKPSWLERETTFNVDRVQGATLFTDRGKGLYSQLTLQTVGAFRMARKPIEFIYMPAAAHAVQRPRERQVLMDAVVDWMSFWLQGYEDPTDTKKEMYTRWRSWRAELARTQQH